MATLKEKKRKLKKMRARNIILNMVCVCLAVSKGGETMRVKVRSV